MVLKRKNLTVISNVKVISTTQAEIIARHFQNVHYLEIGLATTSDHIRLHPGLMKDHGQQARTSENFAGPVDFETPRSDLPVHFLNFQKPWLTKSGRGVSKYTGPARFSLALACWPWSFISPGYHHSKSRETSYFLLYSIYLINLSKQREFHGRLYSIKDTV